MQTLIIHDGATPETPRFEVTLSHDAGRVRLNVAAARLTRETALQSSVFDAAIYQASDIAVHKACTHEGAPFASFKTVYLVDPTPNVSGERGAPMGRTSSGLDYDGKFRARRVRLDSGGYDKGGAYWGLRSRGVALYAVEDGMGGLAFVDAKSSADAIATAKA